MRSEPFRVLHHQRGATLILVAITLVVLIGFAALAIDLAFLYVIKGELQNAADSGALAGAEVLYINNGTQVNPNADQTAINLITANYSEKSPAVVKSVERGHWSFASNTFTPNNSLLPVNLWNVTSAQLDADVNFINAVRVITTRKTTGGAPAEPFFAKIFGATGQMIDAVAVAYIGFAGTLQPQETDQPIAICLQAIVDGTGAYTCGVGRMINSGSNIGHQTGGWTNYSQPCQTAGGSDVRPLVCSNGNPEPIALGQGMGTTGGMVQNAYDKLIDCWSKNASIDTDGDGIPDKPWNMTLPVIDCLGNNVGPCSTVKGAVEVNVVWITRTDKNQMKEVPTKMGNWTCLAGSTPQQCWDSFVGHFQLRDVLNGTNATYEDKTIYFLPDCTPHVPAGITGGQNFGILAKIPVLVK
jgi:Flp pilus assembly protein TadG